MIKWTYGFLIFIWQIDIFLIFVWQTIQDATTRSLETTKMVIFSKSSSLNEAWRLLHINRWHLDHFDCYYKHAYCPAGCQLQQLPAPSSPPLYKLPYVLAHKPWKLNKYKYIYSRHNLENLGKWQYYKIGKFRKN